MGALHGARIPPQSLEAEQAALGAYLLAREAIDTGRQIVRPEDFYREAHKLICEAVYAMRDQGVEIDLTTLGAFLADRGQLEQVGGSPYLASLLDTVPTWAHCEYYARIVEAKSFLRRLIGFGSDVVETCYEGVEDVETLYSQMLENARSLGQGFYRKEVVISLQDAITEKMAEIMGIMAGNKPPKGLNLGIPSLDDRLGDLQPGDLMVVMASTGAGKTVLGTNASIEVGRRGGGVLYVSCEMTQKRLVERFLQSESRVNSRRLREASFTPEMYQRVVQAAERLKKMPYLMITPDTVAKEGKLGARITPSLIKNLARSEMGDKLKLVVVDYLQIMNADHSSDNREQEIASIAKALKDLAVELGVVVIALSQTNRDNKNRRDPRPRIGDARESAAIEHAADFVVGLFRESYDSPVDMDPDSLKVLPAEAIVLKNRNGAQGTIDIGWQPNSARWVDLTEEEEPPQAAMDYEVPPAAIGDDAPTAPPEAAPGEDDGYEWM